MSGDNASSELEGACAVDQADLDALRESVEGVLDREAGRLELHAFIDGKLPLDQIIWSKATELGWLGVGLPEAFGGLGMGVRGLHVLHRELGRKATPGPFVATLAAAQTILERADTATKAEWLPRIAAGDCSIAAPAKVDEAAGAGKMWLLGAEDAVAALAPIGKGEWGLVPLSGGSLTKVDTWDRTRTIFEADLAGIAPLAVLPGGSAVADALARNLSLAIASESIGGARAITEQTVAYMKERQQFDRPIASFQALKHRAADLMTLVVSGEEIVSQAVETTANGDAHADMWAALAKATVTDRYVFVSSDCTQLHGGVGYTWEFDVHIHLKRARLNEMLVSTNSALRDRAVEKLVTATRAGASTMELAI